MKELVHRMRTGVAVALVGIGLAANLPAADVVVFDANGDTVITREEFRSSPQTRAMLTRWDLDGNGTASFDEITEAMFELWDLDDNGEIIESEFLSDIGYWDSGAAKMASFAIWDTNDDGEVHLDEFREGVTKTGLYARVYSVPDPSTEIRVVDVGDRIFTLWDRDGDDQVTVAEVREQPRVFYVP